MSSTRKSGLLVTAILTIMSVVFLAYVSAQIEVGSSGEDSERGVFIEAPSSALSGNASFANFSFNSNASEIWITEQGNLDNVSQLEATDTDCGDAQILLGNGNCVNYQVQKAFDVDPTGIGNDDIIVFQSATGNFTARNNNFSLLSDVAFSGEDFEDGIIYNKTSSQWEIVNLTSKYFPRENFIYFPAGTFPAGLTWNSGAFIFAYLWATNNNLTITANNQMYFRTGGSDKTGFNFIRLVNNHTTFSIQNEEEGSFQNWTYNLTNNRWTYPSDFEIEEQTRMGNKGLCFKDASVGGCETNNNSIIYNQFSNSIAISDNGNLHMNIGNTDAELGESVLFSTPIVAQTINATEQVCDRNGCIGEGGGISNLTDGWTLNFTEITVDSYRTDSMRYTINDDGSNMIMDFPDVGGNNYVGISSSGGFFQLYANPNPSNDYLLATITETQGADTELNFYEGGTGHNRFWDSGSMRIGGDASSLCSNLTIDVDCDTPVTGADLVVQDDVWAGGSLWSGENVYVADKIVHKGNNDSQIVFSNNITFINVSDSLWEVFRSGSSFEAKYSAFGETFFRFGVKQGATSTIYFNQDDQDTDIKYDSQSKTNTLFYDSSQESLLIQANDTNITGDLTIKGNITAGLCGTHSKYLFNEPGTHATGVTWKSGNTNNNYGERMLCDGYIVGMTVGWDIDPDSADETINVQINNADVNCQLVVTTTDGINGGKTNSTCNVKIDAGEGLTVEGDFASGTSMTDSIATVYVKHVY